MSHAAESYLPLQEATFFILLSLNSGPKYGYAIMKEVETESEGRVVLSTSTLYSALKRMLLAGWIERVDVRETSQSQRVRKHYVLTDLGQHVLSAEVMRMESLVRLGRSRLSGEWA